MPLNLVLYHNIADIKNKIVTKLKFNSVVVKLADRTGESG